MYRKKREVQVKPPDEWPEACKTTFTNTCNKFAHYLHNMLELEENRKIATYTLIADYLALPAKVLRQGIERKAPASRHPAS
jgi:hypothetical protein